MCAAPAQVTVECPSDHLGLKWSSALPGLVHEGSSTHDDPGEAVSALACLVLNECLLDRVWAGLRQPLDGDDAPASD